MIKEMNLKISGFGPINNAEINLKKLNIIAGKMKVVNQHQVNYYTVF